ncbi:YdeI/OmpD-associated family protein [Leifsonia sp. fls2-241-R2A-40a]|uniref:YdeI/OmpD-associated family protein n=1 Tax=Leifsonia sp. fls2-241-R2A-40a TaxID=3040290 RepID=UPI00254BBB2B|nr:YdeI/OmpD-associated family protein [Leifsonia sp. fls2-241-R2A-40a]
MPSFRATILQARKTATGIPVPDEVVAELGAGKKPAVTVRLGSYEYRSTIARMGEQYLIPLSAEHRAASGVSAGDEVDVVVVLDVLPREVPLPPEVREAFESDPALERAYAALSYSRQRALVEPVDQAKTAETRQRRVEKVLAELASAN